MNNNFTEDSIYGIFSNNFHDKKDNKLKPGIAFYDKVENSPNDIFYMVEKENAYRPDLISQKFYNTPYYDWVICIANNIKDPLKEFEVGTKIIIPDLNNYL